MNIGFVKVTEFQSQVRVSASILHIYFNFVYFWDEVKQPSQKKFNYSKPVGCIVTDADVL